MVKDTKDRDEKYELIKTCFASWRKTIYKNLLSIL